MDAGSGGLGGGGVVVEEGGAVDGDGGEVGVVGGEVVGEGEAFFVGGAGGGVQRGGGFLEGAVAGGVEKAEQREGFVDGGAEGRERRGGADVGTSRPSVVFLRPDQFLDYACAVALRGVVEESAAGAGAEFGGVDRRHPVAVPAALGGGAWGAVAEVSVHGDGEVVKCAGLPVDF